MNFSNFILSMKVVPTLENIASFMSVGFCDATMSPNWYFLPSLTMVIASLLSSLATFHASSSTTIALSPFVSLQPSLLIISFSVCSMKSAASALNLSSGQRREVYRRRARIRPAWRGQACSSSRSSPRPPWRTASACISRSRARQGTRRCPPAASPAVVI